MATVWKARQVSLDRIVAIKLLSRKLCTEPTDILMFQKEAQSAAKLKHPNIVQVYDANVVEGFYYFVMEYVAGYTIGEWIRRKKVIPEKEALIVVENVVNALDYAWEREGIVHCDIKPENVMIDADGTVKVTDLGLARTINAMRTETPAPFVMGTPAYMSPEQAQGAVDLDCRADIYSLGAMLYHMVTGKMLFEGNSEERILELQVTGTDVDPIELNPKLSPAICMFIEKMLAKNRQHRYKDWKAVKADLERVIHGKLPSPPLPPGVPSTITRSPKRELAMRKAIKKTVGLPEERSTAGPLPFVIGGLTVLLIVGIIIAITLVQQKTPPRYSHSYSHVISPEPVPTLPPEPENKNAQEMYEFAEKWMHENPGKYSEAIEKFKVVASQTKGTKYALMAQEAIKKLIAEREQEKEKILNQLSEKVAPLIENQQFEEAAKIYESYSGSLSAETIKERTKLALELRERQKKLIEAELEKERQVQERFNEFVSQLASCIVTGGVASSYNVVTNISVDTLGKKKEDYAVLKKLIADAVAVDSRIVDSFRKQLGSRVTLSTVRGKYDVEIIEILGNKIKCRETISIGSTVAFKDWELNFSELTVGEKLQRMDTNDTPEVALARGAVLATAGNYPQAKECFQKTHPIISSALVEAVDKAQKMQANVEAEKNLIKLMQLFGITTTKYEPELWLEKLRQNKPAQAVVPKVSDAINEYRKQFGNTDFGQKAEGFLSELLKILQQDSGDKKTEVTPEQRNVEPQGPLANITPADITKELINSNPQLIDTEINAVVNSAGALYKLEVSSPALKNIQPISALKDLKELGLGAVPYEQRWQRQPTCELWDLAPLKGLQIKFLYIGQAQVRNLLPIKDLPLTHLSICHTPVSDLSPLRQMPLEVLELIGTAVRDLTPLTGMKIKELCLHDARIYSITPLSGMPLERLDLSNTDVKDLTPLRGAPLKELNLSNTKAYNFNMLQGMNIVNLYLDNTQISDLMPLRGMPLERLSLNNTKVSSIMPLKGMRLRSLSLANTAVKDFTPIKDMPLEQLNLRGCYLNDLSLVEAIPSLVHLDVSATNIRDITPLKNLPLRWLAINDTAVKDIEPIKEMNQLRHLEIRNTRVRNLEPLRGSQLVSIVLWEELDPYTMGVLRTMPRLKVVNGRPWQRWFPGR
jgi:serine/threonine protein kinase/Leucine-rich repeat (LRR) protein